MNVLRDPCEYELIFKVHVLLRLHASVVRTKSVVKNIKTAAPRMQEKYEYFSPSDFIIILSLARL